MWAASVRLRGAALRRAATGRPSLLRHCTTLPAGTTLRVQAKGAGDGVGVVSGVTPQVVSGATTPTPSPSEQLRRELKAELYWQAVVGAVAAVAGVAVATVAVQNWWQERSETIANNAADVLLKSKVDDDMELSEGSKAQAIVPRSCLAVALTTHLEKSAYVVVEGPRGTGKTTGVLLALSGKPGVLRVKMTNKDDACVTIAKALRMPDGVANAMTQTRLEDVLRKTKKAKGECPTIIAELSRDAKSDSYGRLVVSVLKELCVDKRLVKVVIVLGDADAAFAMPEDFARQKHIWVNDFNEDDAHIYLDKLGAPQARNELFYEAGTRPMHLLAAAEDGFQEFIALAQGQAEKKIRALLYLEGPTDKSSGPAFKQLIIDLLENTGDGRSLQGFDESAENLGLPSSSTDEYLYTAPEVVADLYKTKCHAVLYHQPSDTWRFHSTSHRRAAERMFPEAAARGAAAAVAQSAAAAAKSRPDSTWWSRIFG